MRRPDLNILIILDAVYRETSVTKAAERLNLTQSAISHALGRLRLLFDDPLFIRKGNRLVPTPLARTLAEEAAEGLRNLEALFDRGGTFDPAENARTFTIGVRDVLEVSVLPPLVESLEVSAPQVSLKSVFVRRSEFVTRLASGSVDAVLDVYLDRPAEILSERVSDEEFCVLARKGHPLVKEVLDLDGYLSCGHVQISARQEGDVFEDCRLHRLGCRRKIRLRCQHYLSGYRAVKGSNLIATMPRRLAEMFCDATEVQLLPVPFEIGRMDFYLYWHASMTDDPANNWFRRKLKNALRWRGEAEEYETLLIAEGG
ncbi:MAG: LysR family transcriptional regulator [Alphaproteobacteria bacterium]|nr:MAG: LysR family transcriptional regulator [Alphaproteobacteria bacterium]